ncbi:GNAT family N-acetyltransferase [Chryseomicrobium palamuruense]|uniref:GNAT family N-acetyltransferase n=1 Tax=Chryseomicrobium palamuruense TaxID=682973 RepID=A0ABV8UWW3_9BACL
MEYVQITSIQDPLFAKMHQLMQDVFPAEEVLEYALWEGPLQDPTIRMFVAVEGDEVVGATEYRFYADRKLSMTDFTLIGKEGIGVGPFLAKKRNEDLQQLSAEHGIDLKGVFAEIYDPYRAERHEFGGLQAMNPFVRREVLAHLGFKRLDFSYVHPSWTNEGNAVTELDFCFLPLQETTSLTGAEIADFLKMYYAILTEKPADWHAMVKDLESRDKVELLPL